MNVLRTVSYISRRTYSNRTKNVGIQGKLKLSKRSGLNLDIEEINHDDLDEFEAEYMNASQFYDIHEREEEISHETLKSRIVATKYFKKDKDPNFLTSIEKYEIRKLHKNNPEEWTIERLSESFPALPETIQKILKSNWSLTSVKQVLRYDTTVMNNWKQFQAGTLPLSPLLQEHLTKFKNRTIVLPDTDLLAKTLIPPKPELPRPRSKFFSEIINSYLEQNKSSQCNNIMLQENEKTITKTNISNNIIEDNNIDKNIVDYKNSMKSEILDKEHKLMVMQNKDNNIYKNIVDNKNSMKSEILDKEHKLMVMQNKDNNIYKNIVDNKNSMKREILDKEHKLMVMQNKDSLKTKVNKEQLTFNEFAKKELPKIYGECPEEGITLLHAYKKHLESQSSPTSDIHENTLQSKPMETSINEMTLNSLNEDDTSQIISAEKVYTKLDTYIKVRNSKIKEHETYPLPIKIPKNIYKKGKTYRICDCYYDDDGQFLYRVPGVQN